MGELDDEVGEQGNPLDPNEILEEFYVNLLGKNKEGVDSEVARSGSGDIEVSSLSWIEKLIGVDQSICNNAAHVQLRDALASHIWAAVGIVSVPEIFVKCRHAFVVFFARLSTALVRYPHYVFLALGCVCKRTDQSPPVTGGRHLERGVQEAKKTHEA